MDQADGISGPAPYCIKKRQVCDDCVQEVIFTQRADMKKLHQPGPCYDPTLMQLRSGQTLLLVFYATAGGFFSTLVRTSMCMAVISGSALLNIGTLRVWLLLFLLVLLRGMMTLSLPAVGFPVAFICAVWHMYRF